MVKTHEMASAITSHLEAPTNSSSHFHIGSDTDSIDSDYSIVTTPPMESNIGMGGFNHFNGSSMLLSQTQSEFSMEEMHLTIQQLMAENHELKQTVQKDHLEMQSQVQNMTTVKDQIVLIMEDQKLKRDQAKQCIEQLRAENEALKEDLQKRAKMTDLECQIKKLKTEIETEKILHHQLKADYDELLADYNQIKQSFDLAMNEKSELVADYAELKNKYEELCIKKDAKDNDFSYQFVENESVEQNADVNEFKVAVVEKHESVSTSEESHKQSANVADDLQENMSLASAEKSIKNLLEQLHLEREKVNETVLELESEKSKNHDLAKRTSELEDTIKLMSEQQIKIQNGEKHLENNLQDSERKFAMANSYIQKYKDRCDSLETWLNVYQGKLDTIKTDDSNIVLQLREEVQELRKTLEDEKQRSEDDKKQLLEERQKNATLMEEHKQLKDTWDTMFHEDSSQLQTETYHLLQIKAFQEREDSIHAKLVLLEETLRNKDDELTQAHEEILKLKRDLENLPLLEVQLEVYKKDFEDERRCREALHNEKEWLSQELARLKHEQQSDPVPMTTTTVFEPNAPNAEAAGGENLLNDYTDTYSCPKCGFVFDSFQPLLNHVNSCLDSDTS